RSARLSGHGAGGGAPAVRAIGALDRRRVRELAVERFSSARMAEDYLVLYRRLLDGAGRKKPKRAVSGRVSLLDGWSPLPAAEKRGINRSSADFSSFLRCTNDLSIFL
ncbi:MAG: hypothetical protein AB7T14_05840, partial [Candidatus Methylacidiphilaceae bacterium]